MRFGKEGVKSDKKMWKNENEWIENIKLSYLIEIKKKGKKDKK